MADYFDMLRSELLGAAYSKTAHRRELSRLLHERSDAAIERKHQNISAVLLKLGLPPIDGYKPLGNYQKILEQVVEEHLLSRPETLKAVEQVSSSMPTLVREGLENLDELEVEPPELRPVSGASKGPPDDPQASRFLFSERDAKNRELGRLGEELVLRFEMARLAASGRRDLAGRVVWTSSVRGDGFGYDIESFEPSGQPVFVEVKTTNLTKRQPFLITRNEVRISQESRESYRLTRVYQFSRGPRLFVLHGAIDKHCLLTPKILEARFG